MGSALRDSSMGLHLCSKVGAMFLHVSWPTHGNKALCAFFFINDCIIDSFIAWLKFILPWGHDKAFFLHSIWWVGTGGTLQRRGLPAVSYCDIWRGWVDSKVSEGKHLVSFCPTMAQNPQPPAAVPAQQEVSRDTLTLLFPKNWLPSLRRENVR